MSDVRDSSRSGGSPSISQPRPNLEQKKKLAKELLRAFRRGDSDASERVRRHLPRFFQGSEGSGSTSAVAGGSRGSAKRLVLAEAQFVVARESGFASWPRMKRFIEASQADEGTLVERLTEAALAGRDEQVREMLTVGLGDSDAGHLADPGLGLLGSGVAGKATSSVPAGRLEALMRVAGLELRDPSALLIERVRRISRSIHAMAALADDEEVLRLLDEQPQLAAQEGGPRGWAPIFYACHSRFRRLDAEAADRRIRIVERLLEMGVEPAQTVDAPGVPDGFRSVLTGAVECVSSPRIVETLLGAGAKRRENWALWAAAELRDGVHGDDLDCLRALLRDRPPQYQLDFALSLRVALNEPRGVKLLLKAGASPDAGSWGAHGSVLHQAIRDERSFEVIEALLQSGANIEQPNRDGYRPYQIAVRLGRSDVASFLSDRGVSTDLEPVDRVLSAALQHRAGRGTRSQTLSQGERAERSAPPSRAKAPQSTGGAGRPSQDEAAQDESRSAPADSVAPKARTPAAILRRTDHQMLAWALSHDRGRSVPALLNAGLDPNVPDDEGDHPLHLAVQAEDLEALDALLQAGADPTSRNHAGRTALDLALEVRHPDVRRDLVELLTAAGAPLLGLKAFPSGDSELDEGLRRLGAVEYGVSARVFERARDAVVEGDAEQLRRMMRDDPALIHARSPRPHRSTLLHYMAANGVETEVQKTPPNALEILRILIDAGAEVDALCNCYGGGPAQTTLALLASSSHPAEAGLQGDMVRMLVEAGANPNGLDDDGVPLATAIAFRCPQALDALAQCGACIDNLNFAAAAGDVEAVHKQVDSEGNLRPDAGRCDVPWCRSLDDSESAVQQGLVHAAQFGRLEVVRCLIEAGADVNAGPQDGMTALHEASFMGHIEVVRYLLQEGADPALRESRHGGSALGWAKEGKREEIAALLLEHFQPDIIDAVYFNLPERVRELLEDDPSLVHAPQGRGVPLRAAAHHGHLEIASLLLQHGADPHFQPDDGDSALQLARKAGHQAIVQLFVD